MKSHRYLYEDKPPIKKSRLFLKYALKYLIILLLIIACCIPIVRSAYSLAEKNVRDQSHEKLRKGLDTLEGNLSKMYSMSLILKQDIYSKSLGQINGELSINRYVYMNYLKNQISNMHMILDFPDAEFILFINNDIYVSDTQVNSHFSEHYGAFLQADDLDVEQFRKKMFAGKTAVSFYNFQNLKYYRNGTINETKNPIVCAIKNYGENMGLNESSVMVFVIEKNTVLDLLLTEESFQKGFIQLKDGHGQTIFNYGVGDAVIPDEIKNEEKFIIGGEQYNILHYANNSYKLSAVIGFSEAVVQEKVEDIVGILLWYLVVGFVVVLCLALLFSYRQYLPVANLIKLVSRESSQEVNAENEYDFIQKSLLQITTAKNEYRAKLKLLDSQLKSNILENLFIRGVYTKEEKREFERSFSIPIEYFCVVIMHMKAEDQTHYSIASLRSDEYMRNHCHNDFISVQSGMNDHLFLILMRPEDASNVAAIKQVFEQMTQVLTKELDMTFNIGISAIGKDIFNVHNCYHQARQALRAYFSENANSFGTYHVLASNEHQNPVNMDFLQKLHNFILCGEKALVSELFGKVLGKWQKAPFEYEMQRQQLFYYILHSIYSTSLEISCSPKDMMLPAYHSEYTPEETLKSLESVALKLCDCVEENKKSKNTKLKNDIFDYLKENYKLPELTTAMICQNIGISEKYLFQFLKEQTGKTLLRYLEELRLSEAEKLLKNTSISNEKIAEKTGFGSVKTFYRVFHKYYGISPGAFRENLNG